MSRLCSCGDRVDILGNSSLCHTEPGGHIGELWPCLQGGSVKILGRSGLYSWQAKWTYWGGLACVCKMFCGSIGKVRPVFMGS